MKNNNPFVSNNSPYILDPLMYFLLKNRLYTPATAKFPINVEINPINNKIIESIGLVVVHPVVGPVCTMALENILPTNVVTINNTAVIIPHINSPIQIFPKSCPPEILFGSCTNLFVIISCLPKSSGLGSASGLGMLGAILGIVGATIFGSGIGWIGGNHPI